MGAAEKHEGPIPFWPILPAGMNRAQALAYTAVSEVQMRQWEREGTVRFVARGPNGAKITQREQLDEALRLLFGDGADSIEFPEDGD